LTSKNISFQLIYLVLSVIFISIFAQIEIELPLNQAGISISGQTFAVLLVGFFLGAKWGALAVLLYVAAGAIGAPVFSGGASGMDTLAGPSLGYLVGFIVGAYAVGSLADRGWHDRLWKCILVMTAGTGLILLCGVLRLSLIFGVYDALESGFFPFISGGLVKVTLGGLVAYFLYPLVRA